MALAPTYLLDTNILVHYARGKAVGRAIESHFKFQSTAFKPIISIITAGEIFALANRRKWGPKTIASLHDLLDNVVQIPLDSQAVVEAFAKIDTFCKDNGYSLCDNDLWIASTAHVLAATLVTADNDFLPLSNQFFQLTLIDNSTGFPRP